MELDYKSIGKRVKSARIRKKITQEKLAEKAGISVSHISNIERGSKKVSLATIINIANALDVSVDDLLCENVIRSKPAFQNEIKKTIDDCSEFETRIIAAMASAVKETIRCQIRLNRGETFK